MNTELISWAQQFTDHLTSMIGQIIDDRVVFTVIKRGGQQAYLIRPFSTIPNSVETDPGLIPLQRECDDPGDPRLFLKAEFRVTVSAGDQGVSVTTSSVGLWVNPDATDRGRPVVRLEYDRSATGKPAAHVHFHSESTELAWVYGTAGEPLRRFHDLHFPMGGRRFRPTLEDFLLFLDRERLFTNWKTPNWRSIVMESHAEWEARQARSTARRHPQEVAAQLRSMGYQVSGPA